MHKTTLLWEISPTFSVICYFRQEWLAFLLCLLASTAWLLCTFWYKPAKERLTSPSNTSFQLSWCSANFLLKFIFEDRACYKTELKPGWHKNNRKGLRGLTGMWWDWHWCDVGGFLTQTCLQGWRCSQRDNSVAFSHQRRQPALNLSECLSSSEKNRTSMSGFLSCATNGNVISIHLQATLANKE